jgi:hypothetical protein
MSQTIGIADLQALLSVGQIASRLGRSPQGIYHRLKVLNIEPVLTLPVGGARYDPSVVEVIGAALRRPNYNCRSLQSRHQPA